MRSQVAATQGRARLFGAAGLFAPDYLLNMRDTVADTLVAGHDQLAWDVAFARGAPWLLDH
ncbi:hypothetical protein P0F65_17305 [Sphingomonas sp. I4]